MLCQVISLKSEIRGRHPEFFKLALRLLSGQTAHCRAQLTLVDELGIFPLLFSLQLMNKLTIALESRKRSASVQIRATWMPPLYNNLPQLHLTMQLYLSMEAWCVGRFAEDQAMINPRLGVEHFYQPFVLKTLTVTDGQNLRMNLLFVQREVAMQISAG